MTSDSPADLASIIDHTLLKPDATSDQYEKLFAEAVEHRFCSVCVPPDRVSLMASLRSRLPAGAYSPLICTVIGFPLGYSTSETKAVEARDAIAHDADELDMVIPVGVLKDGDDLAVTEDIRAVVGASAGKTVKVILETASLTDDEIRRACDCANHAGARFVKTSTGFGPGGATEHHVALMRECVGPEPISGIGVKASGGIRDRATAEAMVAAGATRLGCSASIAIVTA